MNKIKLRTAKTAKNPKSCCSKDVKRVRQFHYMVVKRFPQNVMEYPRRM